MRHLTRHAQYLRSIRIFFVFSLQKRLQVGQLALTTMSKTGNHITLALDALDRHTTMIADDAQELVREKLNNTD